ncbi:MAG: ATP-binding protein [Oscillospiraceae bacterium]|nr:ATP-binding protein [Eubacteriales bacterium]MDY2618109.1 ATP-binding protein [Oscillospiraceae bacterium]
MSSAELRLSKRASTAGSYIARSFFRTLMSFLVIDAVVMLCFDGALWQWLVLSGIEVVLLIATLWRSSSAVQTVLAPLETLADAAESLKDSSLDASELRKLARKLERVDAQTLTHHVSVTGGKELSALGESINAMLERIDRRYQAQVRFTSDASHELRTPISVIQGYADLLDRWGKDDPQIRQEAIDAIRQEAAAMGALVEQLLFLVRGDNETQKVTMAETDLTALVTAVARETDMVDTTHQVTGDVQTGVTGIADAAMVKECLRVLCDNALKYTPEGGSVDISLKAENGWAKIAVTDTGMGIPEEDLAHIFDRFFRSEQSRSRSTGGTGLGLAIAAWIAARHAGRIDVTSRVGLGSRFTLTFPLTPPEPEDGEE